MGSKKRIAVLGSTGSIGQQALDVVHRHGDLFQVDVLSANLQWQKLVEQAKEFVPKVVVIGDTDRYADVRQALKDLPITVYAGSESLGQAVVSEGVDIVLVAIVGFAGLLPTLRAIEAGKTIALANKESLVVAGDIVTSQAAKYNARIIPVDSEHSAIFQCLAGELTPPEKLIITASGGPFRGYTLEQLRTVTPMQALAHPTWSMGAKISIDSATLMNKGFEVMEAHWLFNIPYDKIEVVVHPQSTIHSMVQFADGTIKAQLGPHDMRLPIQYALSYPFRLPTAVSPYQFGPAEAFTFEQPDVECFPCLGLALRAGRTGGNLPAALNAANEVAVEAFLAAGLPFTSIPIVIERTVEAIEFVEKPCLDDYIQTDQEARRMATWVIEKLKS